MNKLKNHLRGYACLLLCFLMILTVLPVSAFAETPEKKVVRVGWYEDSYNITGENGERSGYGYEYQQSVAAYTGWTYEYVKAGWSDLLVMLQNGEIDLMSGVSYTDERAQSMLFSDLPMGEEKYYLYADLANTDISASNLETLNGKRIGLLEGSVHVTQYLKWEKEHGLHLEHVSINGLEDALDKLANHEIECVISTETPKLVEAGMSAIVATGSSDIYFVINKNRSDLKDDLDCAMRKIAYDKPFYADELYQKYLSAAYTPVLDGDEQEWLAEHGAIRVGWINPDPGISIINQENGEMVGVLTDYIRLASNCLANQTLQFELESFDSLGEEMQALKDGNIDMIFHFSQNPYAAEQNGFVLSNAVLAANMAAVTTQDYFNENAQNRVAIEKDNLFLRWYVSYHYPDWQVVECESFQDVENAVRGGDADCFIAEAGQLTKHIDDTKLHNVFLTQPDETSFAVRLDSTVLLSILNKTLRTMSSSMLTGALSMYDNPVRKVTMMDFVKDNLVAFGSAVIMLFLVILLLILSFLHKSRIAEAKAKQAASETQKLNRKLQESQRELQTALLQAESANSAKTTFLSNVSHDIRTPINAIVGLTSLMEHDIHEPDKLWEYLAKLKASSKHLLNLINEILDMNKIESGKMTLNIQPFSMAEQVAQIDNVIRPQTKERSQNFIIQTHNIRHENVMGDATRLQQVLLNILSNSIKYTDCGGIIELDIEEIPRSGHYVRYKFTITDNGIGMSEEFQKHIYESFTRAEASVTNQVQGTGLGMAITKSIVDMMGGAISLNSQLGKGTQFEVMLEFKIDKEADDAVKQMSLLLLRCGDEYYDRIKDATANHPVSIYRTTGPKETEELLAKNHYDVVMMPYLNYSGDLSEAVQKLRKLAGKETVLLGVATAQRDEALETVMKSGLDGFVALPFFLSNVEAEVARVKERRAGAKQEEKSLLVGMKFLCAEDNAINSEILQAMLEMQGASCVICSNGAEIAERFKKVKPGEFDAILMDVQMPIMDGYEATRAIRGGTNPLGKTIPIIAMTANAFAEDVQKSYDAGMDAHLSKPVDMAVLEETLRKFRQD